MKSLRLILTGLVILSFSFCLAKNLNAVQVGDEEPNKGIKETKEIMFPDGELQLQEPKTPEFVPGELIVKLKDGKTLDDIKELNDKYKVTKAERVFKESPNHKKTLEDLKAKLASLDSKDHQSWYWQMDKDSQEYKDYIARIEKEKAELNQQIQAKEALIAKLEQRQKRAPEGATPPNLDGIYLFKTDKDTNIPLMMAEYKVSVAIEYAEPNYLLELQMIPNDPRYSEQWAHKNTKAELGWDIEMGDPNVVIAIIDTGVDYNHEDLTANIWINQGEIPNNGFDDDNNGYIDDVKGWDFYNNINDPIDTGGHGTHCAGIAAAVGNNGMGVTGVCQNCRIMSLKTDTENGEISGSAVASAVTYAADNGADITSNSYQSLPLDPIKIAFEYAYSQGVLSLVAAGNNNSSYVGYFPAHYDSVISIASTTSTDSRASSSNYGSKTEVAAPGDNILSTIPGNEYGYASGTSMATPYAAGVAGVVLSYRPEFTNAQLRQVLRQGIDEFGKDIPAPDQYISDGRINLLKVLQIEEVSTAAAKIISPEREAKINGNVNILGSAGGAIYKLEAGFGIYPSSWTVLNNGTSIADGILGVWNTTLICDGIYTLKLTVIDGDRSVKNTAIYEINNVYLTTPNDAYTVYRMGGTIQITAVTPNPSSYTLEYSLDGSDYWSSLGIDSSFTGLIRGTWDTSHISQPGYYYLKLTSTYNGITSTDIKKIYLDYYKDGWPVKPCLSNFISTTIGTSSPTLVDIDENGFLEVVIGTDQGMCFISHEGTVTEIQSLLSSSFANTSPAVGDIDGDGHLEIVAVDSFGILYAWRHDGSLYPGWPIDTGTSCSYSKLYIHSSPTLADIDRDGDLEVIIGSASGQVLVFEHDGNLTAGWPQQTYADIASTPAVADLDNDGYAEIIATSFDSFVYVWKYDGTRYGNWPKLVSTLQSFSSPVIGDVDSDGDKEIIVATRNSTQFNIYLFDSQGNIQSGWPVKLFKDTTVCSIVSSPALADLDNDGKLEIVVGVEENAMFVLRHDGSFMSNWPQALFTTKYSSPIIGDIDGDNDSEIVAGTTILPASLEARNHTGDRPISWPKSVPQRIDSTGALGDIDVDGKLEIVIGGNDGYVYAWDLDVPYNPDTLPWPMFQHDPQHTGNYHYRSTEAIPQTPWQTNSNGTLSTNIAWNYTMGYHFTPQKSGQVTKLGGFFNGTKTVYLWEKDTGTLLGQAQVTSANNWSYTSITPVNVQAGKTYTVAAYLAGSGGSYRVLNNLLPQTYGDIKIEATTYTAGNARPTGSPSTMVMYGQVDIEFFPQAAPINHPPELATIGNKPVNEGQLLQFIVSATDQDGDALTYSATNLPSGASFNSSTRTFSWTPSFTQAGTYSGVHFEVSDGKSGNDSEDISITVNNVLQLSNVPSSLSASAISSSQINLSWIDNSTNETGFKIERKTGSTGTYSQIATVGANVNTYSNTGLTASTTYYYRVRAYNSDGNSSYSNEAGATTQSGVTVPVAPTNLTAQALSAISVKLTWSDNSNNETGFKIERSLYATTGFTQIATVGANIATYTNTGLTKKKTYYYRVRAYNTVGNSNYSNTASATTPKR